MNYDSLKAAVKSYSNRTDITDADFATFVQATEARLWRLLRLFEMQALYDFTIDPVTEGRVVLPTAHIEFKNIYVGDKHLEQLSIEQYIIEKNRDDSSAKYENKPTFFVRYPDAFYVWPYGSDPQQGNAIYYSLPPAITDSNQTTDLFEKLYDAYLYGCLVQCLLRYGYDERVPLWEGKFQESMVEIQTIDKRQEYSGSVTRIQPRQQVYKGY